MKTLAVVITLMGACFLMTGRANAQDPVKVAPGMNKVVVNNAQVRVLDVMLKPGEKMPMHSHPDNVLYVISGGTNRSTDAKGKSTDRTFKDGECVFRKGETHMVENVGKKTVHVLNIELKK
jgi:quercetin dioxygenase-like cupin family protein